MIRHLLTTAVAFSIALAPFGIASATDADIIFIGSSIVSVDPAHPNPEAVAIKGETIVAVGTTSDVMNLRGDNTRIVELGGRALVPGFIDAHGHMAFVGGTIKMVNLSSPPVGSVKNIDDIVKLLKAHIEEKKPPAGTWISGYGYDDSLIAEGRHPDRDDLDRASITHPIALMHVSGHLAAVNSTALAEKKVDKHTKNPKGGVIRRREGSMEPNGVLEETAIYSFLGNHIDPTDHDLPEKLIRDSAHLHASYGITTAQDGGSSTEGVALFRRAASTKPFPIDIVAFPAANRLDDETLSTVMLDKEYKGGFRVGGIKFVLDGSPQGRTAYLSRPYAEGPPGADKDYRAYMSYPAEDYKRRVAQLIHRGMPVLAHANGDAAIDVMIEGVADAVKGTEMPDHRTVIIHAQLTREDQLHKIKALGLVPSYYAVHPFFWGDWHRKSFGEERASFISPVGRTAELGIPFTIHNDSPVVPPDVMRLLWITVNRETRSGYVLGPDQRATPMQALHAVTLGAAYQYFEEAKKGSIAPGKQADLVILGANPITVDPGMIKDIPVLETIARGKTVYRAHANAEVLAK